MLPHASFLLVNLEFKQVGKIVANVHPDRSVAGLAISTVFDGSRSDGNEP